MLNTVVTRSSIRAHGQYCWLKLKERISAAERFRHLYEEAKLE